MKLIPAATAPPLYPLPLYMSKISAGFPSPADDYIDASLDLNEHLVTNKTATFFLRVKGDSMAGAHIHDRDLLIANRALSPAHRNIVAAVVNGEITVKYLYKRDGVVKLQAANPKYRDIVIPPDGELVVWGVCTHVIHTFT